MKTNLLLIPFLLTLVACTTLYTSVVTITTVVDDGMKQWAKLSIAGKTTPVIDAKVKATHDRYRQACATAEAALVAYKANADQGTYIAALVAAKAVASELIDLIVPLVTPQQSNTLKANLAKATKI